MPARTMSAQPKIKADDTRARIMEKLDVHSAVELVLYAVRKGIIS